MAIGQTLFARHLELFLLSYYVLVGVLTLICIFTRHKWPVVLKPLHVIAIGMFVLVVYYLTCGIINSQLQVLSHS